METNIFISRNRNRTKYTRNERWRPGSSTTSGQQRLCPVSAEQACRKSRSPLSGPGANADHYRPSRRRSTRRVIADAKGPFTLRAVMRVSARTPPHTHCKRLLTLNPPQKSPSAVAEKLRDALRHTELFVRIKCYKSGLFNAQLNTKCAVLTEFVQL